VRDGAVWEEAGCGEGGVGQGSPQTGIYFPDKARPGKICLGKNCLNMVTGGLMNVEKMRRCLANPCQAPDIGRFLSILWDLSVAAVTPLAINGFTFRDGSINSN